MTRTSNGQEFAVAPFIYLQEIDEMLPERKLTDSASTGQVLHRISPGAFRLVVIVPLAPEASMLHSRHKRKE